MNKTRLAFTTNLLLWLSISMLYAQTHIEEITAYRKKQLQDLTIGEGAPLKKRDASDITYFEINGKYRVEANIQLLKEEKPFNMPTYEGTTKEFIRFARLHFEIDGVKRVLTAYKNLSIPGALAALNTTFFIPFKDETNGEETYGGGRYLDLPIPKGTEKIQLDFNKAYNPYCAYSDGYRCPVPPFENHLSFPIRAGEKHYTGTKRSRNKKR